MLVLLVGGGGHLDLNDKGCANSLNGNVLFRMQPQFRKAGLVTVLVDSPSDFTGEEGLGGFRTSSEHAADLGRVFEALRARFKGAVWVVGHSRGTISAVNAAARLAGAGAPDGLILLSPMLAGQANARKAWVKQSVFSVDLEKIKIPVLAIGHAADTCVRSPAKLLAEVIAKTESAREQVVTVTGGPVEPGRASELASCEVGYPHDFVSQETAVAEGILRFIKGEKY